MAQQSFAYVNTTTPGKLAVIEKQIRMRQRLQGQVMWAGLGVSLVGHSSQLERHRDELLAYGILEQNQYMVDWDNKVTFALREEAQRINFQGHIVLGDINNVVRYFWKNGHQVDVIDYDDVGYLEYKHESLITEACQRDVKLFNVVNTTRGNWWGLSEYLDTWRIKLDCQPYVHQRGNLAYSWGEIQRGAVQTIANKQGYEYRYWPYKGLSTMNVSMVIKPKYRF